MKITDAKSRMFANDLAYFDPLKLVFLVNFGSGYTNEEMERHCETLMKGPAGQYYREMLNNRSTDLISSLPVRLAS